MEGLFIVLVFIIIYSLFVTLNEKSNKRSIESKRKKDLIEAKRRRNQIQKLSENEIIKFAKEKSISELGEWINYKGLLKESIQMKYYVISGWEDNECYTWFEVRRKSDDKCIFPTFDFQDKS